MIFMWFSAVFSILAISYIVFEIFKPKFYRKLIGGSWYYNCYTDPGGVIYIWERYPTNPVKAENYD